MWQAADAFQSISVDQFDNPLEPVGTFRVTYDKTSLDLEQFSAEVASQFVKSRAKVVEHVAREERLLAGAAIEHGDLGGAPAEPRVKPGCVKRREFLRE